MTKSIRTILFFFVVVCSILFITSCDMLSKGSEDETGKGSSIIDEAIDSNGEKHFLGRGYDVFSEYALEKNLKEPLLNFAQMKEDGILEGKTLEESTIKLVSGDSAASYAKSYSAAVGVSGSYQGFTASVSSTFGSDATSSSVKAFASVIGQYKKYIEKIYESSLTPSTLTPYITSNFHKVIENISKETSQDDIINNLFKIYGTHIITGAYHGGFLSYSKSTSSTTISSAEDFGLAVSAGYSNALTEDKANLDTNYDTASSEEKAENSANAIIEVRGGDSVYATNLQSGLSTENFGKWLAGFSDKNKWVLCGFTSGDAGTGLYPITEFFSDAEVKTNVENAFQKYEEQCQSILSSKTGTITYKVTLTFNDKNIQCGTGDASNTDPEFYGFIKISFKSENESLWYLTEGNNVTIPKYSSDTWNTIDKGCKIVSFQTTNPTDSMNFAVELKEDDLGNSDDVFSLATTNPPQKLDYTINELITKIKNDDPYILFTMKGGNDLVLLRVSIAVEQSLNK